MAEGFPQSNDPQASVWPRATESIHAPVWAHVLPFVIWLFVMQMLGDPAGWKYALRSLLGAAALWFWRPWRGYPPLQRRHLPAAFAVGGVVLVVWILPETAWAGQWPRLQSAYETWGIMPLGRPPAAPPPPMYAPEVCGWPLTLTRIAGSALVIAVIEEFFWRGFVYRWLIDPDFLHIDPGMFRWGAFLATALLFGLEHHRWLVGFACGVFYGGLAIRTRDVWAVAVAHGVTNLLLGLYVVTAEQYQFWS